MASAQKIWKVCTTSIGKWPINKFYIDYGGKYFLLRCMLDLGSTSFAISPEAAKDFALPVVIRTKLVPTKDVSGEKSIPKDYLRYHFSCQLAFIDHSMRKTMHLKYQKLRENMMR